MVIRIAVAGGEWVELPLPLAPARECVWHYTSAQGLLGILRTSAIWATSPDALNDTTELEHGQGVLSRAWEIFSKEEEPSSELDELRRLLIDDLASDRAKASVFVTSASGDGDALNQWHHYAHEGGFSIGFAAPINTVNMLQPLPQSDGRRPVEPLWSSPLPPTWYQVIYDVDKQLEAARLVIQYAVRMRAEARLNPDFAKDPEGITAASDSRISGVALAVACCMKHPSFEAEKEVRLVTFPTTPGVFELHRVVGGRFVPYVELGAIKDGGRVNLPIEAIRVGRSAASGESGLRRVLDSYGYADVKILESEVPLR